MVYICIRFRENILNGFRVMERTQLGHDSVNITCKVIVLVLCTLSNPGPCCSKLTTSLVNVLLNFQ